MAYLVKTAEGQKEIALALKDPFAPQFPAHCIEQADRLEIWSSSFSDPGEDWDDYRLFADGEKIDCHRTKGY